MGHALRITSDSCLSCLGRSDGSDPGEPIGSDGVRQDLAAAVEKMNSSLTSKGDNFFHQDEIASLGLGVSVFAALGFLLYGGRFWQ